MGYRGEDLDLRTPQTWTAVPADTLGGSSGETQRVRPMLQQGLGRSGPIWVDDVVLACSNHAFDVALAHRSSEVRLEHLLHALTRVDIATDVLEAYGVHVGQLRRDSATYIASEIPVGLGNGHGAPRRSDELEDVLRMAAGQAARRNSPASVGDLLHVMLELTPDVPGLQLFQRNLGARPNYNVNSFAEVMPPMARNPYTYDPIDTPRDRLRSTYTQSDLGMRAPPRQEFSQAPVDSVQNTRLDALEQMVRTLGLDLQNERKLVATVLQDVQREIGAQRDDTSRLSGGLHDRLQTSLGERLQGLENAVINMRPAGATDMAPLFDRLSAMERALQTVIAANQRTVELLNDKIATLTARTGGVDLTPVINRLDIIEEAVLSRDGEGESSLVERFEALDARLTAETRRATEAQAALLADQKSTASGLLENVSGKLERQRGEIAAAVLTPLTDKVNGLAAFVQKSVELAQAAEKTHTQELSEVHEALMKLNANQHTLAGSVDQWRRDASTALGGLASNVEGFGTRFAALEKEQAKPMQMLETMSSTMDNMHRVTVERYYRRNRFWYWLFGTDDWVASSWPSHAQRISDDLKAVKTAVRAKV